MMTNIEFFEVFPWNKNFVTGIELIDEQHKQLVIILNKLATHLVNKASPLALNEIFNSLTDYADYHFKSEEQIWQTYFGQDIWLENHQQTHHKFIDSIKDLQSQEENFEVTVERILKFLVHWLAFHILDTDKRMAKVVLAIQAGGNLDEAKQQADHEMNGAIKLLIDTVLTMYDSLSSRTLELMREKIERLHTEEALKASEERWKFVLEGVGDGIWDWNIHTGEVYHSSGSCWMLSFFEKNNPETIAQIHPDDLVRVKQDLESHLAGHTEMFVNEYRVVHDNGSWSWLLTRGKVTNRDGSGKALRMIGTHTDITERELAAMVFQNSSEAIMITDLEHRIVSVNPTFSKITGYAREEVIGKSSDLLNCQRQDNYFYPAINQKLSSTGHWEGELWSQRKNGQVYPQWRAVDAVFSPNGSIYHYITKFSDISYHKQNEELIWRQANFDELTGLPNRHTLYDRLYQEIKKSQRSSLQIGLIFIDLDHFKSVNETLGHPVGDILLKDAAQRLLNCVRKIDTVARLGGDEFAVILTNPGEPSHIQRIAQDILGKLTQPFYLQKETLYLSASLGITIYPDDGEDVNVLLKNADQAMYHAKDLGRNRFCYFTKAMQEAAHIRMRLTSDLRNGLIHHQFVVFYQPIVNLSNGMIHKAEALIRWQHPEHGLISPASFIPIAEETGMILEIGNWVFEEAAKQVAKWRELYHAEFQISVNKSPIQFRNETDLYNCAAWCLYLKDLKLPGHSIVVEITEGLLMDINERTAEQLLQFRDAGVQVALDDFGTGYSSLSYLNRLDIDYIKIDQSFTRNLTPNSNVLALCEAMIVMAHRLGIKVIAEGIETQEQKNLLIAAGCDYGQGYLFSKPIPAEAFEQLLTKPSDYLS